MTENKEINYKNISAPSSEVPTNQQQQEVEKQLITLTGITTSRVEQALKAKIPYPARVFLKLKGYCQYCEEVEKEQFKCSHVSEDIPVFFRIKEKDYQVKPCLECNYPKKGNWEKQVNCQTKQITHQVEEVWIKPKIKKGSYLQVEGYFSIGTVYTKQSERKSFTAIAYQLLNQELNQQIETHGK